MNKILSILTASFFACNTFAQKTELQVQLNSGLFSYTGKSAVNSTFIIYSDQNNKAYTNNPYGSNSGLSLGVSGNIKRVTKKNWLLGADIGLERLRSKTKITEINSYNGSETYNYDATGQTYLNNNFLNVQPYFGHRLMLTQLPIDLSAGLDLAYLLSANEKGKATDQNGKDYTTSEDRKNIKLDFRPRFQVETKYRKIGLYAGYSMVIKNYKSSYIGGTFEAYARFLRFGLTYQLK